MEIGTLKASNARETERCLKEVNSNMELQKEIDELNNRIKELRVNAQTISQLRANYARSAAYEALPNGPMAQYFM